MSQSVVVPRDCWQPELRRCGDLQCSCGFLPGPLVQASVDDPGGEYRWLLLIQGEALCSDAQGRSWRLQPGDVFIRPAGGRHRIVRPDPARYLEWFLCLSHGQMQAAREWGLLQNSTECFHLSLEHWLGRLLDWCRDLRANRDANARARHWNFLIDLLQEQGRPEPDRLREAECLLSRDMQRPLPVGAVAARLGISLAGLRRLMQDAHGMGPKAYQTRQRVQAACGLLMDRSLSIVQVAERLGYPDAFTFSKQFKRVMGQSPSSYRRW